MSFVGGAGVEGQIPPVSLGKALNPNATWVSCCSAVPFFLESDPLFDAGSPADRHGNTTHNCHRMILPTETSRRSDGAAGGVSAGWCAVTNHTSAVWKSNYGRLTGSRLAGVRK